MDWFQVNDWYFTFIEDWCTHCMQFITGKKQFNWVLGNYVACWKEILGTKFVIEYSSIFYEISGYHIQNYAIKICTVVRIGVLNAWNIGMIAWFWQCMNYCTVFGTYTSFILGISQYEYCRLLGRWEAVSQDARICNVYCWKNRLKGSFL